MFALCPRGACQKLQHASILPFAKEGRAIVPLFHKHATLNTIGGLMKLNKQVDLLIRRLRKCLYALSGDSSLVPFTGKFIEHYFNPYRCMDYLFGAVHTVPSWTLDSVQIVQKAAIRQVARAP